MLHYFWMFVGFCLLILALGYVTALSQEKTDMDEYRGCVASAYQAEHRGVAGTTLIANLAICDQLLLAN